MYSISIFVAMSCGISFANYGIVDGTISQENVISQDTSSLEFPSSLSFKLVRRHLYLSYTISTLTGAISGPVDYIKMLEDGIRFDVVRELTFVADKGLYLSTYITTITNTLNLIDGYNISLQEKINQDKDTREKCIQDKKDADDRFFAALTNFDQAMSDTALQSSMSAGSCEESMRISIVATTLQLRRISQLHTILSTKKELLTSNADMIVHYFPLVQQELLQKLLALSSQLQNLTISLDK